MSYVRIVLKIRFQDSATTRKRRKLRTRAKKICYLLCKTMTIFSFLCNKNESVGRHEKLKCGIHWHLDGLFNMDPSKYVYTCKCIYKFRAYKYVLHTIHKDFIFHLPIPSNTFTTACFLTVFFFCVCEAYMLSDPSLFCLLH